MNNNDTTVPQSKVSETYAMDGWEYASIPALSGYFCENAQSDSTLKSEAATNDIKSEDTHSEQ